MRKLIVAALATAFGASVVATAPAHHRPGHPQTGQGGADKVTVCHRTNSAKKPYTRIRVPAATAARHATQHPGDIVNPVGGQCPTTAVTAQKGGQKLTATQTLASGATVTFTLRSIPGLGQICYTLTVTGLTDITGAHIHRLTTGAIVVPLATPTVATGATAATSSGCVTVNRALVKEILKNPGAFFVNVHTVAVPAGVFQALLTK